MKLRFSMRTLMLLVSVAIIGTGVIAERVRRQQVAVHSLLEMGCHVQFLSNDPKTTAYATGHDNLSHWYRSIETVWLYPTDAYSTKHLLDITATIPNLTGVFLLPNSSRRGTNIDAKAPPRFSVIFKSANSVTDDDIDSIVELLPNIQHLTIAPASCSSEKANWLKTQMGKLKSGTIMFGEENGRVRSLELD